MGSEQSHETRASYTKDHKDGCRYWADFDSEPFARGSFRLAFRGNVHGKGPRDGSFCVTKVFMKDTEYTTFFADWKPDFEASVKAARFAEIFTHNVLPSLQSLISTAEIEFVIPLIAKMESLSHFKVLGLFPVNQDTSYIYPKECVAIEPYLDGEFEKFNSNCGYEDETAAILNTFSHWTWHISGHRYLVCDLQGVRNGAKYILTDPCNHSRDGRFGMTDLGVVGMEQFLITHKCNALCARLGLKNPLEDTTSGSRRGSHTVYNFQLADRDIVRANEGRTAHFTFLDPIVE